jgi:hypothetical protein
MTPTTPTTARKRGKRKPEECVCVSKVESSNICKRIERAMRLVGIPATEARTRYARLVGCVRAMRGSAQRWHAGWALYNIMKDWLTCPGDQPASENFQSTIMTTEEELADLCYENVDRDN